MTYQGLLVLLHEIVSLTPALLLPLPRRTAVLSYPIPPPVHIQLGVESATGNTSGDNVDVIRPRYVSTPLQ